VHQQVFKDIFRQIIFQDYTVKVWDVQQGEEIRTLQGHNNAVYCLQV